MKINLTLAQIVNSVDTLKFLGNLRMPVKSSYRINKMLRKVASEVDIYEEERKKIFEEFGEDMGGGRLQIKEEHKDQAAETMDLLLNQDVELDIPEITLEMMEGIEMSPLELQTIEPLLTLPEE